MHNKIKKFLDFHSGIQFVLKIQQFSISEFIKHLPDITFESTKLKGHVSKGLFIFLRFIGI